MRRWSEGSHAAKNRANEWTLRSTNREGHVGLGNAAREGPDPQALSAQGPHCLGYPTFDKKPQWRYTNEGAGKG